MGLIKTAMIAGVGIYGINKISSEAARRNNREPQRDSSSYNPRRDLDRQYSEPQPSYYQQQGPPYYDQTHPPPQTRALLPRDTTRAYYDNDQYNPSSPPLKEARRTTDGKASSGQQAYQSNAGYYLSDAAPPPAYYSRPIQQGYVEEIDQRHSQPREWEDERGSSSREPYRARGSSRGAMIESALASFSGGSSGSGKKGKGAVQDLLAGFLEK